MSTVLIVRELSGRGAIKEARAVVKHAEALGLESMEVSLLRRWRDQHGDTEYMSNARVRWEDVKAKTIHYREQGRLYKLRPESNGVIALTIYLDTFAQKVAP